MLEMLIRLALSKLMGPVLVGSAAEMSGDEVCRCRQWLKGTMAFAGTMSWDAGSDNCCAVEFW
ncbi:hypothetical protein FH972_019457 [Carpinus fangiana]|uniref:Secreted protein n=1 Tax=Carpinus fangiana TaxID=176857 RepID=A0A5N6RTG7_9ROSI|nr:hypothetical protein FH972_019457 [Carpinus fangiana]